MKTVVNLMALEIKKLVAKLLLMQLNTMINPRFPKIMKMNLRFPLILKQSIQSMIMMNLKDLMLMSLQLLLYTTLMIMMQKAKEDADESRQ